jgi:hypothetical protein
MRALAVLGLAVLALGACGGSDDGQDLRITLVVEDKNIRVEDSECAGARPFQYVHAQAGFELEDGAGKPVADGELPAGHAVNADPTIDWGVDRIPTFCVFDLELDDVPRRDRYSLRLGEGSALPFDASFVEGGKPVTLTLR